MAPPEGGDREATGPPFDASIHLCTKEPNAEERGSIAALREQLRAQSKHYVEFEDWLSDDMLQRFLIAQRGRSLS